MLFMSGAVGLLCGVHGTAKSSQLTENPGRCDIEEVDILVIDQQPLTAMLPFCRQVLTYKGMASAVSHQAVWY